MSRDPLSFPRNFVTIENWRTHPSSQWSFQNVREMLPTAEISGAVPNAEARAPSALLETIELREDTGQAIRLYDHLRRSHADSLVVLKNGKAIAEWHAPHVDPDSPHLIFSITKSVTGLLAGLAVEDGALDPDALVADYVPMPAESAYATATVRHLLDMTVSLDFDEAYLGEGGAFERYRRSTLWNPQIAGGPTESLGGFLGTLASAGGPHGEVFHYASPNTDLLGLVVERATGTRWHTFLADRFWKPLGAKGSAYVTVDRVGTARAAGGLCVTPRDLARIGQLVMDEGKSEDGRTVIPASWIGDMRRNGDRQAWIDGDFAGMFENGRYRSCWYETGDARDCFAAVGIHGQWIWGDRTNRVVIAKTSSRPVPSDDAETQLEISMLSQLAKAL